MNDQLGPPCFRSGYTPIFKHHLAGSTEKHGKAFNFAKCMAEATAE